MSSQIYFEKLIFHGTQQLTITIIEQTSQNPITDTGEIYKHDNIYDIYIYVFVVTVFVTIFFFTLTTIVAHGEINNNVM